MYSILIIEDDSSYRSIMEKILKLEGFIVRSACDGRSGLAMLHENPPDMVLCDIKMPVVDGHMVLETLRKAPATAGIPLIFISAMGDRADIRRGMSQGADDYLPKPFSAEELIAAVTGRIRRHASIKVQQEVTTLKEERALLRDRITRREREVLLMVGRGATSREIASQLAVTLKTVEVHRANLMRKLGAANAASLARWAVIAEIAG